MTASRLELVVFRRAASRLVGRVLLGVDGELAVRRGGQVDSRLVAQSDEVEEHVRGFERDVLARLRRQTLRFVEREPLEVLDELPDLSGERHREVLRVVETVP